MPSRSTRDDLPHGQGAIPDQGIERVGKAFGSMGDGTISISDGWKQAFRDGKIEIEVGGIDADTPGEALDQFLAPRQFIEFPLAGPRLLLGAADVNGKTGKNGDQIGIAAEAAGSGLEIRVIGLCFGFYRMDIEDGLRILGGEIASPFRAAGLHQQRATLRRAGELKRPRHGKVGPHVIDPMDPGGIAPHAGARIGNDRAFLPAIPKLEHGVDEIGGNVVALVRWGKLLQAEVGRRALVVGGHDIPAHAPPAGMVQREKSAGQVVGIIEGRRRGEDETDAVGRRNHGSSQHDGIQRPPGSRADIRRQGQDIGEEDGIEESLLAKLGDLLEMSDVDGGKRTTFGSAPGGGMGSRAVKVEIDVKLSGFCAHKKFVLGSIYCTPPKGAKSGRRSSCGAGLVAGRITNAAMATARNMRNPETMKAQ